MSPCVLLRGYTNSGDRLCARSQGQDGNSLNLIRLLMEKPWRLNRTRRVTGGLFNHGLRGEFEGIKIGLHCLSRNGYSAFPAFNLCGPPHRAFRVLVPLNRYFSKIRYILCGMPIQKVPTI